MIIKGIQKTTLLDYPGKVAATIFTGGCNFRCPFCHNASLVIGGQKDLFANEEEDIITEEDIFAFLGKRQGILDGVCITGGEPLIQNGIEDFIRKIKELGFLVKLDTNGSFPEKMIALIEEGLVDYVAMDIKNSPEKYDMTAGLDGGIININSINKSIDYLKASNIQYEFRTTVVKELHNIKDIEIIGKWLSGANEYYLQSFKDSGDLIEANLHEVSKEEMIEMAKVVKPYFKHVEVRGI
ncbi:MAG: anaerobic ribonucleoside-triphosphate reductase activating protein [Lachnospiraceae bacterium]|jgi:pyruvate formate lyase activating enzyme|nr:anaerobic ribonucleoside-triphosphate reductase activating protein [Lachnospiraceae bacterium]